MLEPDQFNLLKKAICATPHDVRNAFEVTDLVDSLANLLPARLTDKERIREAMLIIAIARRDDGTPATGMIHFPGFEYPYLPDKLVSDGNGYLIRLADAPIEFTAHEAEMAQHEAEDAQHEAEMARLEVRRANAANN
jgi:hypothetical protein